MQTTGYGHEYGRVYLEVHKGVYGLPHVGILANKNFEKWLNKHEYYQGTMTPGLWKHKKCSIQFALVVNDFGVKYINNNDVQHLITALTLPNTLM